MMKDVKEFLDKLRVLCKEYGYAIRADEPNVGIDLYKARCKRHIDAFIRELEWGIEHDGVHDGGALYDFEPNEFDAEFYRKYDEDCEYRKFAKKVKEEGG